MPDPDPEADPQREPLPGRTAPARKAPDDVPPHLELKATLLLWLLAALVGGVVLFLLHARGAFETTQRLVLTTEDADGVLVGMDLKFSGFPIGRVERIELAPDGRVRIDVDVPVKDAHWLRESSVFVLERGLVGNTTLRAFSNVLTDPPLPAGAERAVLRGDATTEIPRLVAAARELVQNVTALTASDAALAGTLGQLRATTERLNGPQGALGLLVGEGDERRRLNDTLARTQALLARVDGLVGRVDGAVRRADEQVLGTPTQPGAVSEARAAMAQLDGLLRDTRASLAKVDAVLDDAKAVSGSAREATVDLVTLRAEVEASLRRVDRLLADVNRLWPFAREPEIRLP